MRRIYKKEKVQMWVVPEFKNLLKKKAIDKGMDVLSLTKKLAIKDIEEDNDIFEPITKHFKRIL